MIPSSNVCACYLSLNAWIQTRINQANRKTKQQVSTIVSSASYCSEGTGFSIIFSIPEHNTMTLCLSTTFGGVSRLNSPKSLSWSDRYQHDWRNEQWNGSSVSEHRGIRAMGWTGKSASLRTGRHPCLGTPTQSLNDADVRIHPPGNRRNT